MMGLVIIQPSPLEAPLGWERPSGRAQCHGRQAVDRQALQEFCGNTAAIAAQVVAMMDVPTMAVGLTALLAARMAMAVAGMSWIELVLMAR
jgi:hypothetical protein